ncbi:MAG: hypothetical protein R3C14_28750 [Caldilineaceae bacterium]
MKSIENLLTEADRLLTDLILADAELATALEDDSSARRQLKDAEQALSLVEAELVTTAVIQAKEKQGPLAGLAVTSDAYKMAVALMLAKAHAGSLQSLAQRVQHWQIQADGARVQLEQTQTRFSAIRHASNLVASMLAAASTVNEGSVK